MSTALDRKRLIDELALLICEHPEHKDGYLIDMAHDELFDSVTAIRRDQREFERVRSDPTFQAQLNRWKEDARNLWVAKTAHSVRVPPHLTVVKGGE